MINLVDCHNHMLWDMDDGAIEEQESLDMARQAVSYGFSTIFVTPHLIPRGIYEPKHTDIVRATTNLRLLLKEHEIPLTIKYGCEFRLNDEAFDTIERREYVCYEDTDWILVEFTPNSARHRDVLDAMNELKLQGKRCVIAHPERYFEDVGVALEVAARWSHCGAKFQLNRTAVLGLHGDKMQQIAHQFIAHGYAHLVATDAHHNYGNRLLRFDDVHQHLKANFNEVVADTLCIENPKRLYHNEPMLDLEVKAKSWWQRNR